jgi:bacillithiol biosynthesis cysteine-adding enzyme BshC
MGNLFEDYCAQRSLAAASFARDLDVVQAAGDDRLAWGAGLREALPEYQTALGLDRDIPADATVVITGQQPGIFTGPLYTIYKAVTAIRLARKVAEDTGRPCVPVFWVGGDDHDFEEVREVGLLTKHNTRLNLRFDPADHLDGAPMYRVDTEASLQELIDLASAEAPGSEYADGVKAMLESTLENATSLAHWFALLMARLFEDTELCIFVPHLAAGRTGAVPILRREIEHPLKTTALANEGGAALIAAGYEAQVEKGQDECSFFLEMGGRRRKVLYTDGRFHIPEEKMSCTQEEMLTMLETSPERFTPNVVLRPVVQQALFPAAAYVAGPGEIAYWAQLRAVFDHMDQPMPVVYPRSRAVLTSIKLNKLLKKYGFSVEDLYAAPDALQDRALRAVARNPALEALEAHKVAIRESVSSLGQDFSRVKGRFGDLPGMHATFSEHVEKGIARLERALLQADEAQVDAARKQVERLCVSLAPDRKPQERVYTIFSWLFAYGPELVPRLVDRLDTDRFDLQEVEL